MNLRIYQLPFILTLIAMPINWIVGVSGIGVINWIPEIFALLVFAALMSNKSTKPLFSISQIIIFLMFSVHLLYQVLGGKGVGGSAFLSVILMVLLYLSFFKMAPVYKISNKLIYQVSAIYVIHVIFIVIEVVLLKTGNADIFSTLSGGNYKPAKPDYYSLVPQSLFKQSQAAAQLCVFAVTWFWLLYLSRKKLLVKFKAVHGFVIFAAVLLFATYPNTTAYIVGVILIFSFVYFMPVTKTLFLRLVVLITGLALFGPIYQAATYKISRASYGRAEAYINAFMDPIKLFFEQPLFSQLWGLGSFKSVTQAGLEYSDFGLGVFILQMGIILVGCSCVIICALFIRAQVFAHRKIFDNPQPFSWIWLGSANALLAVGNLMSLVHYTVALQTGGRALFSFHIAITIFSLQQLVQYRRIVKSQVSVK